VHESPAPLVSGSCMALEHCSKIGLASYSRGTTHSAILTSVGAVVASAVGALEGEAVGEVGRRVGPGEGRRVGAASAG
jgi:hypothetical protein